MTIIDFFEAQEARAPDAVAVHFESQYLTYAQLNRCANQLAHHLRTLGVGAETLVGVFMERSVEMVIALYGVLKAGAAYVPIDPDYPVERIAFMLHDTQAPVLLTQSWLSGTLSRLHPASGHQPTQICLDLEWGVIAAARADNPTRKASTGHLAYVIYTSGSTGQPKGVMNGHLGILNRLLWMQDAYPLTAADRVVQKTPFSFDVSVWEFFWPLMFGACLVIAKPGGHKEPGYLVDLIARQGITVAHFVPSMLQVFLSSPDIGMCTSLKRVFCSGEALSTSLQERFFQHLRVELHNLYGPTEAAIDVTYWHCQPDSRLALVPIGRPVANTRIHLLDADGRLTPTGEPGELYIGGVQVARGYLNRPRLTAERFLPDPFSTEPGSRFYRTGDLARCLPDGAIVYLGRMDNQVKIRGNRVELGEIEATLLQYPSVGEAVVTLHEFASNDQRLVAYLTVNRGHSIDIRALRSFLAGKLPDYMMPAAFTLLDAMPLTPNGKIDRRALPGPKLGQSAGDEIFVAPRNAVEEQLAAIWAQTIGLDRVGIHDNFFELGGDSILAIQITAKANQTGLHVTPSQLLEHQTVERLAAVVGAAPVIQAEQGVVTGSLPLTPIQHWFFQHDFAEPHHWNQAVLLRVDSRVDATQLEHAIRRLLLHHDALRLRFNRTESGWRQAIFPPEENVPFVQMDLSALTVAQRVATIQSTAAEAHASLDLSHGPLARVIYYDLGADKPRQLLFVIHNLAVDGISWRILVEQLGLLCEQSEHRPPLPLPAKTTSYKQWAELLAAFARSEAVRSELPHWLSIQNGPSMPLPRDYAWIAGENSEASARIVSASLDVAHTQLLLKQASRTYRAQVNDLLLAALAQVLTQWIGASSVLIDLEGHGREAVAHDVDLLRTVGWFIAVCPVRLSVQSGATPAEAVNSVKEAIRRIPNRGIGYGLLRYLSHDTETVNSLRALPEAEVSFNYLGQFDQGLSSTLPIGFVDTSFGIRRSPRAHRCYLLEISGEVVEGQLTTKWIYGERVHRRSTIEKLADNFVAVLKTLVDYAGPELANKSYQASDFPNAGLDQQGLDALLEELRELDAERT